MREGFIFDAVGGERMRGRSGWGNDESRGRCVVVRILL